MSSCDMASIAFKLKTSKKENGALRNIADQQKDCKKSVALIAINESLGLNNVEST